MTKYIAPRGKAHNLDQSTSEPVAVSNKYWHKITPPKAARNAADGLQEGSTLTLWRRLRHHPLLDCGRSSCPSLAPWR